MAERRAYAILALVCLGVAVWFGAGATALAASAEPEMPREVRALQRRLVDAKCYAGPVDGKTSDALSKAIAACPDQRPALHIETGMHVSFLKRMAVDAACRFAVTGSTDKTVRLWSLPEGRLLRTLRVPIGPGNAGAIYAVAISRDGKWIAAGGFDLGYERGRDNALYVFEAATGAMAARIGGFKTVINHILFSRDGRWLAAVAKAPLGARMVDTTTWTVVAADDTYQGDSYGADFGADGQLYTVAFDHKLRRYGPGPAFEKRGETELRGGRVPFWVAIDPNGATLAVDYYDRARIELYETAALRLRGTADTRRIGRAIGHAGWRTDGATFAAGGYDAGRDQRNLVSVFDRDGRRVGTPWPVDTQTITDVRGCGGGFAVATGGPSFGLFDAAGASIVFRRSVTADMREKVGGAFTISADARRVRFGLGVGGETPVLFDLAGATLTDAGASSGLHPASTAGVPIAGWHNNFHPTFAGRAIALDQPDSEMARALAVRPDRAQAVLASDHWLRAFDPRGGVAWKVSISQNAWGLDYSADGRILVAALGDGTIRWYRAADGGELLALFVNKQTRAWVAWTPSGYYSAAPGGEDMIGWHVNRGLDQAADFFPASRFRDKFARPDIVERVLATLGEGEAVKAADAARHVKPSDIGVAESLPPVVSIVSPTDGESASGDVGVTFTVRSPSGLPVDSIEALVDGRPVPGVRGLKRLDALKALQACLAEARDAEAAAKGCRGNLVVALPPGAREIGLFARSGTRASEVAKVRLAQPASAGVEGGVKPNLYALVIGISSYGNKDYALAYAAKDAQDFAASLRNQKGGFYGDVEVKLLADREASAKAINDGLDWLGKHVTRADVGLVYLAGHGLLGDRDRFYFLAADSDVDRLRATALSRDDIADALNGLAGKALLFLDTCHAGAIAKGQPTETRPAGLDINTIVNAFSTSETGVVVFAASTGRQLSEESDAWHNGAFTKALVEGLGAPGGKPLATVRDGRITTSGLDAYVTDRVRLLTKGAQSPVMIRPPTVPDFAIAAAR